MCDTVTLRAGMCGDELVDTLSFITPSDTSGKIYVFSNLKHKFHKLEILSLGVGMLPTSVRRYIKVSIELEAVTTT